MNFKISLNKLHSLHLLRFVQFRYCGYVSTCFDCFDHYSDEANSFACNELNLLRRLTVMLVAIKKKNGKTD